MSNEFFSPSDKHKNPQFTASTLWATIKERFETCPDDKAFALRHDDCSFTETQLRSLVSRKARQAGRSFRVIKHVDDVGEIVYEIGPSEQQRTMMRNDDVFDHSHEEGANNEAE